MSDVNYKTIIRHLDQKMLDLKKEVNNKQKEINQVKSMAQDIYKDAYSFRAIKDLLSKRPKWCGYYDEEGKYNIEILKCDIHKILEIILEKEIKEVEIK